MQRNSTHPKKEQNCAICGDVDGPMLYRVKEIRKRKSSIIY